MWPNLLGNHLARLESGSKNKGPATRTGPERGTDQSRRISRTFLSSGEPFVHSHAVFASCLIFLSATAVRSFTRASTALIFRSVQICLSVTTSLADFFALGGGVFAAMTSTGTPYKAASIVTLRCRA